MFFLNTKNTLENLNQSKQLDSKVLKEKFDKLDRVIYCLKDGLYTESVLSSEFEENISVKLSLHAKAIANLYRLVDNPYY